MVPLDFLEWSRGRLGWRVDDVETLLSSCTEDEEEVVVESEVEWAEVMVVGGCGEAIVRCGVTEVG